MKPQPPNWPLRFLRWYCREDAIDEIEGDLVEIYNRRCEFFPVQARRQFTWGVLRHFRPEYIKSISFRFHYNNKAMIKNYFKIAWRNLIKNKVSSFINIGGLAAGMAVAILIGLWIYDELSFNKHFENYDRIARVVQNQTINGEISTHENNPIPLGVELRNSFKSDFKHVVMSTQTKDYIISAGEKTFTQAGNYMQKEAPEMLTLRMIAGSREGLKELNSILLSKTLAGKLFGEGNPLNNVVKIDNELNVKVTGVYEDFPDNTEFSDITFIAPWDLLVSSYDYISGHQDDWNNNFLHIYVQVAPGANFDESSSRIKNLKLTHVDKEYASRKPALFLQPMSKWHLFSKYENGLAVTSEEMKTVRFYGIVGLAVLLLACINFMNLSTARSEKRAKEVGIRKAIGSVRKQLINQFFSESLLTAALAFIVALLMVQLILPWFNQVADKKVSILWSNPLFWMAAIAFILFTGLIAGSYPALYLSSLKPVKVLKGTFRAGRFAAVPRKVLVVLQFSVSVSLIIGTIIVYRQIQFAKNRPVGYSRDGLLTFQKSSDEFNGKHDVLRNELIQTEAVLEMAESSSAVTDIGSMNGGFDWNGKQPGLQINFGTLGVTYEYGKTIGWQFVSGRDFSKNFLTDSTGFIINETAAKQMGLKAPVGETIKWETDFFDGGNFKIIGVVKDMVMKSPFEPIKPTIFFLQGYKNFILVKLNPSISVITALSKIEPVFKKIAPSAPFDYKFADEEYAAKFVAEERTGQLSGLFAILAIFISFLGLFGLASFLAEQRIKEIGIRKILGASLFTLWHLLSAEFLVLVLISLVIAAPTAWYFMNSWLQNYEYRVEVSWWIFAAAGAGALLLTILTVTFHAIKAALSNPVKSLRTE